MEPRVCTEEAGVHKERAGDEVIEAGDCTTSRYGKRSSSATHFLHAGWVSSHCGEDSVSDANWSRMVMIFDRFWFELFLVRKARETRLDMECHFETN